MNPLPQDYIVKAKQCLSKARKVLELGLNDEAGRIAYLAGFHAAEAIILNRTGKIAKTHSGVRSEFARIAKNDPDLNKEWVSFLGWAYDMKTTADYLCGYDTEVPRERAEEAIATAERFVSCINAILTDGE